PPPATESHSAGRTTARGMGGCRNGRLDAGPSRPPTSEQGAMNLLMTIPEAAKELGRSADFVRRQLQPNGPIPWVRWGQSTEKFIRADDLVEVVRNLPLGYAPTTPTLSTEPTTPRSHHGRGTRKTA